MKIVYMLSASVVTSSFAVMVFEKITYAHSMEFAFGLLLLVLCVLLMCSFYFSFFDGSKQLRKRVHRIAESMKLLNKMRRK